MTTSMGSSRKVRARVYCIAGQRTNGGRSAGAQWVAPWLGTPPQKTCCRSVEAWLPKAKSLAHTQTYRARWAAERQIEARASANPQGKLLVTSSAEPGVHQNRSLLAIIFMARCGHAVVA